MSVLCVLLLLALTSTLEVASGLKVVLISDIHFDAFYGTPLSPAQWGCATPGINPWGINDCDSPLTLVESAVADITATAGDANLTIFTGDWLRHDMATVKEYANSSIAVVAALLSKLPGHVMVNSPKITAALGNNDFVPDYTFNYTAPTTSVLSKFAHEMRQHNLLRTEKEFSTFHRCGFYHRQLMPHLTMIVLNSLVWGTDLQPGEAPIGSDPCGQLAYLNQTLIAARASNQRVYISSHVPPTVNLFSLWKEGNFSANGGHFWRLDFLERYEALVEEFSDIIAVQFYGHTHMFAFLGRNRTNAKGHPYPPLFINPSISPVFGNTPSYLIVETDDTTGDILEMTQRNVHIHNGSWMQNPPLKEKLFNDAATINSDAMQWAADQMMSNRSFWEGFRQVYGGGGTYHHMFGGKCEQPCQILFACYCTFSKPMDVKACVEAQKATSSSHPFYNAEALSGAGKGLEHILQELAH